MTETVDLFGNKYEVVPCVHDDVAKHFAMVKDVVGEEEVAEFIDRMHDAIELHTAFALSDHSCFLYYINYKPCCATGVAIFGEGVPNKMMALFAGIFMRIDKETFKLDFHLHPGKFAGEYRSIIEMSSLKRNRIPGSPLIIRVDSLKKKINKLYEKMGVAL